MYDQTNFSIYLGEHGYQWGYRSIHDQGEGESTDFDLTDPVACATFASSMLNYAQNLLQDAIMSMVEERTSRLSDEGVGGDGPH